MDTHQRIAHRVKIARGHMEKVLAMIEHGDYCIDILTQSQAVQGALKEVDALILENHLNHCVADAMKEGRKDEAIAEVVKVFRRNQ